MTRKKYKPGLCPITDGYNRPKILKNFISLDLCQKLIDWAAPRMKDAEVIAYDKLDSKSRNNKVAWMNKKNKICLPIIENAEKLVRLPRKNFEDLQIAMYYPGMYFHHHTDQCKEDNKPCHSENRRGGLRIYTILLYLNDGYEGGETDFNKLKMRFKPPAGSAVLFENLNTKGDQVHPLSEHAGLELKSKQKWIANFWIREDTFF